MEGVRQILLRHCFLVECLLVDDCPAALILVLYIIGAIGYGLGLIVINYIKDVGPPLAKKIWKAAREKVLCKKGKTLKDQNELQDSELSGIDSKTEVETKKAKHLNIAKEKDEEDDFYEICTDSILLCTGCFPI